MALPVTRGDNSKCVKDGKTEFVPAVLIVGSGLSGGGAEARLSRLVPRFFNGQVDLALLSGDKTLDGPAAAEIFFLQWKSRISYPRMVFNLWRIIRKGQYDAVMAFGLFPIAITAMAIIGLARRPKFIVSEITRPIVANRALNRFRRIIYFYIQRLSFKRGDLITANSIDGLVEACQLIGANPKFGVRLPNIVDIKQIESNSIQETPISIPEGRYLICVGRLEFMKRIDTVIDAFSLLKDRKDCRLVIVGDGVARQALKTQVRKLGLLNSVTFTGNLVNPFPLLKNASAFILASEFEGFSNSALEAMFCDVPLITSFCSSDAREMCDYGAALGFKVGDSVGLSKHMSAVLGDEAVGRQLMDRARVYRAPHEINLAIPVYEDVIRNVIG